MTDFTSALYLGWTHAWLESGAPPQPLTLGKPAALQEPPGAVSLARRIAQLTRFEAALCAPSTLHLAIDVSAAFARQNAAFFVEDGIYPICRYGVELAQARGCPVYRFPHHDPAALSLALRQTRRPPVVVAGGFCPSCGALAPLASYLNLVRRHEGILLIDDSQALGILGSRANGISPASPYGSGGGGSFSHLALQGHDIVVISSLSKAFGAPVACLLGSSDFIRSLASTGTRLHSSPPSTSAIRAGLHALERNAQMGDPLRRHLFQTVTTFRSLLQQRGWKLTPGAFPVQAILHPNAPAVHARLLRNGIRALLQPARVIFILNATHQIAGIHPLVSALDRASTT